MQTFNTHDAKTRLSELLERVEAGEDIIIARAGKPIARLTKVGRPPRAPGYLSAEYRIGADFASGDEEIARLFLDSPLFPDSLP